MIERPITICDPLYGSSDCADGIYAILAEQKNPPQLGWKHKVYYYARPVIPLKLRQFLQHTTRPSTDREDWYIDTGLLDEYARGFAEGEWHSIINFWPEGKRWGLALTHDVETDVG